MNPNQTTAPASIASAATTADTLTFDPELLHGSFVMMPAALLRSPDVSSNAVRLYGILLSYAGANTVAWPGQETLCGHLGASERTLRGTIRELKDLGLIATKRSGDGKTMRYHVRKMETRPAKNAGSESSDRQKTPVLKQAGKIQTGKICKSRPAKNDTSYKEELNTVEIYAAATHTPARETEPLPVPIDAAAADTIKKSVTDVSVLPVVIPGPDVSLLDYSEGQLSRLQKEKPEELVRRFQAQNPDYDERVAAKKRKADSSPDFYVSVAILGTWLPDLKAKRDNPPKAAPPSRPRGDISGTSGYASYLAQVAQ